MKQYKEAGKVFEVPIKDLKTAKFNPTVRTEDNSKLRKLQEAIERSGMLMPVLATKNMDVIDGHRRIEVMKRLGHTSVPVIFSGNGHDSQELWHDVNTSAYNISGAQWTEAYTLGLTMENIDRRYHGYLETALRIGGEELVKEMADARVSPARVGQAKQVARYVGMEDDDTFLLMTLRWITRHTMSQVLRKATDQHLIDPSVLKQAILSDKPLKFRSVVDVDE